MKKVYRDRLLRLADFLDKLPRKLFNLEIVVICNSYAGHDMPKALKEPKKSCGTVACAMGWAPACFSRQIKWEGWNNIVLKDGSSEGWFETATIFFGLSGDEINYLFTTEYYKRNPTPKQVAKVIRKFVKDEKYRVGDYWDDKWEVRPAS